MSVHIQDNSVLVSPRIVTVSRNDVDDFERAVYGGIARGSVIEEEIPVEHYFAPGVYMREMLLRAGQFAVGHAHTTEHFNILLSGTIRVCAGGEIVEATGPRIIRSAPGEKKIGVAITDCRWLTIHATNETDPSKIEDALVEKSAAFKEHQKIKLESKP